jgi:2-isopropylmalate synthase
MPTADRVLVYDTTLRNGTQREGISLSCDDKLRIAGRLDALGVAFIEGGWPGSNPKDAEFFARARELEFETALLAAFGSTRRPGVAAEHDAQLAALIDAGAPVCTLFGKSAVSQVTGVLSTSLDENLRMIEDSVRLLRASGARVIYDAEHFFDGFREDRAYALETLGAAAQGGAEALVLCDTNGGRFPWQIEEVVRNVAGVIELPLGIHAHDDSGCGVANTIAAVRAGARHVQGTINGYGERCGNANLCSVLPNLELKQGLSCLPAGKLAELSELARFVAEIANLPPDDHAPYVGRCAFAHKAGVHVAAMRKTPSAYQHVDPELVGNESRVVVSELSGRGNVKSKSEELGLSLEADVSRHVLSQVKAAEARGFSYEAAEASVALLVRRASAGYVAPFSVLDYQVVAGKRQATEPYAEATLKLEVGGCIEHVAAEGNGPVNALDQALRKALSRAHPALSAIRLVNYKVRILDGDAATGAVTRVLVDSKAGDRTFSTVGASPNIIEASLQALCDALEYGLFVVAATGARACAA